MGNSSLPIFWEEGLRFECQQSGVCCTSRGEFGFVYLLDSDVERLAKHLGLGKEDFVRDYCDQTDGFIHLNNPELDCGFLREGRCGVYAARPEQCRTWPFWPENLKSQKAWNRDVLMDCVGAGQGRLHTKAEIQAILARQEDVG